MGSGSSTHHLGIGRIDGAGGQQDLFDPRRQRRAQDGAQVARTAQSVEDQRQSGMGRSRQARDGNDGQQPLRRLHVRAGSHDLLAHLVAEHAGFLPSREERRWPLPLRHRGRVQHEVGDAAGPGGLLAQAHALNRQATLPLAHAPSRLESPHQTDLVVAQAGDHRITNRAGDVTGPSSYSSRCGLRRGWDADHLPHPDRVWVGDAVVGGQVEVVEIVPQRDAE